MNPSGERGTSAISRFVQQSPTKRKRSADRPLLPPPKRAIVTHRLWFQLDECWGSEQSSGLFAGNRRNRLARLRAVSSKIHADGWTCPVCGDPVPLWQRADAVYCSTGCRKHAARERRAWGGTLAIRAVPTQDRRLTRAFHKPEHFESDTNLSGCRQAFSDLRVGLRVATAIQ